MEHTERREHQDSKPEVRRSRSQVILTNVRLCIAFELITKELNA